MKIHYLAPLLTVTLTMVLFGCDLQKPEESKQPDIEMSKEQMPVYEDISPTADIESIEEVIEAPDEEIEILGVDIPNTDSANQ